MVLEWPAYCKYSGGGGGGGRDLSPSSLPPPSGPGPGRPKYLATLHQRGEVRVGWGG